MALIVARVIFTHRTISRRSAIISAERPPWIVRAFLIRSIPSAVRGPVDFPPCIRHLPFGIAGDRHGLPILVRAPQRGQDHASIRRMRQLGTACVGFSARFAFTPSPRSWCDGSDNRLPSWINDNTLDNHPLLHRLAALAVKGR